jgi:hypothetical protein
MARTIKAAPQVEIDVMTLKQGTSTYRLIGDTPFFSNRMAAKAKRELLFPHGPMTKTQKATKLKHAPYAEYRDSPYLGPVGGPTLFEMIGSAPKMSIASAALRMPTSASKTEIKQLVRSPAEKISLWGIPKLDMSVVRMAGISRTPDIRTRAKMDRWAMEVTLTWAEPMLNTTKVTQLLISAGFICGLGDWRVEKGGEYGAFHVVLDPDDKEFLDIKAEGGYQAQEEALRNPVCANAETEELMAWYLDELARRGINPEDEQPEDITDEDPTPGELQFAAGDETLLAPKEVTRPLPVGKNGVEGFHD